MARAPRIKVPSTTGQGTSRYSYQHAYAMGQKGAGSVPGVKASRTTSFKPGKDKTPPINISYGDTWGAAPGGETWAEMSKRDDWTDEKRKRGKGKSAKI
jgi:hypothetical protein